MTPPYTIGLLTSTIEDVYENNLLRGVQAGLHASGANIICFPGGGLHSYHEFGSQGNILHKLINPHIIDALIISGTLRHTASHQELLRFKEQLPDMPMVGVALDELKIPYLLVDSYQGMYAAVKHLIVHHQRRQIAFLRGPVGQREAEDRFRAYRDALQAHQISFDPGLVIQGDYSRPSGRDGMVDFLARQPSFDAVASANDTMVLGAMEVLRTHGFSLPQDVAVVGFDDSDEGRYNPLPLSTVRQSIYEQGFAAARLALALLAGESVPVCTPARASFIVRRSCGCNERNLPALLPQPNHLAVEEDFASQRSVICQAVAQRLDHFPRENAQSWAEILYAGLLAEATGQTGAFLVALDEVLWAARDFDADATVWNQMLSVLREWSFPWLDPVFLRELWPQARQHVGEAVERVQAHRRIATERRAMLLRQVSDALTSSLTLADLLEVISLTMLD